MNFANLISFFVGASIVILGQFVSHKNTLIRDEKALLREKAEDLSRVLFSDYDWILEKFRLLIVENKQRSDIKVSPIKEAFMIQRIYFQDIESEFCKLLESQSRFNNFIESQNLRSLEESVRLGSDKRTVYLKFHSDPNDEIQEYKIYHEDYLKEIDLFIPKLLKSIDQRIYESGFTSTFKRNSIKAFKHVSTFFVKNKDASFKKR